MSKAYFFAVIPIMVVDSLRNVKVHHCLSLCHWLPLATNDLVDDNRKFEVEGIF